MYSVIFVVIFFSCYLFYNTSGKVKYKEKPEWLKKLAAMPTRSKTLATILIIACWIIIANSQGLGAGTFATMTYVMTFASLIILINPLHYLQWKHIAILFLLCFSIEMMLF